MSSPNHIAGGLFFTGFWCSFWNINIFSRWEYLAATVVFSLLPDIDHPRSPIGIMFYPLARWLDKKFGHRTVTHSLAFLFIGTLIVYLSAYALAHFIAWQQSGMDALLTPMPVIFFFSVLSHLILDMLTIQGVPLFYPIKRNPCVIPGNQDYRFVSGKPRTELIAFMLFIFANFLCWDLYAKGFWSHYNQIFTTIEHMHYERANSPNFTLANYDFIKNGQHLRGKAIVITSSDKSCRLLINDTIYKLDYTTPGLVVKSITAEKTNYPYTQSTRAFVNASLSDVQSFITGRIVSGSLAANDYFTTHIDGTQKAGSSITFDFDNHIAIIPTPSITHKDKSLLYKQLAIKRQSLAKHKSNFQQQNVEYYTLSKRRDDLLHKINSTSDPSLKTTWENELIRINNKLHLMSAPVYQEDIVLLEEIKQIQILINKPDSIPVHYFTGNLSVLNIPEDLKTLK